MKRHEETRIFSSYCDFLPQEKRFFRRLRYLSAVDFEDKHSLKKLATLC